DPEKRKLIWFTQDVSTRVGLRTHPSCNQFSSAFPFGTPEESPPSGLGMLAFEILVRVQVERSEANISRVKEWLQKLCLDPDESAFYASPLRGKDVLPVLHAIMTDCSM